MLLRHVHWVSCEGWQAGDWLASNHTCCTACHCCWSQERQRGLRSSSHDSQARKVQPQMDCFLTPAVCRVSPSMMVLLQL